jgi:flagellin-like hook-associated protein FlgL
MGENMANDIKLTPAMRNNLLSLQNTQKLTDQTQERLSTGLKVNSAIDNPSSYFTAKGLTQRAGDLEGLLDSMGQGIQTLKATNEGIESITSFVEQAKAIATQASESSDPEAVAKFALQYEEIYNKITDLANDASYKGINLLNSTSTPPTTLTVYFNEMSRTVATKMEITGVDATADGLGLTDPATMAWTDSPPTTINIANINTDMDAILDAVRTLRMHASDFGNAYSVLQTREEFTENIINVLTEGSDLLTLADMNEESANMLALQTRQQLGINALSLSSQAAQAVLSLF